MIVLCLVEWSIRVSKLRGKMLIFCLLLLHPLHLSSYHGSQKDLWLGFLSLSLLCNSCVIPMQVLDFER